MKLRHAGITVIKPIFREFEKITKIAKFSAREIK